jgi:hypothetical protein
MPEGSTMYMGVFDKDDVLLTTGNIIRRAMAENPAPSVLLGYSCISRSMSLGSDLYAETDLVRKEIGGRTPSLIAYSGGEICPTPINRDTAINRFHNNAFVICVF